MNEMIAIGGEGEEPVKFDVQVSCLSDWVNGRSLWVPCEQWIIGATMDYQTDCILDLRFTRGYQRAKLSCRCKKYCVRSLIIVT